MQQLHGDDTPAWGTLILAVALLFVSMTPLWGRPLLSQLIQSRLLKYDGHYLDVEHDCVSDCARYERVCNFTSMLIYPMDKSLVATPSGRQYHVIHMTVSLPDSVEFVEEELFCEPETFGVVDTKCRKPWLHTYVVGYLFRGSDVVDDNTLSLSCWKLPGLEHLIYDKYIFDSCNCSSFRYEAH